MTAKQYCELVDKRDRQLKQLRETIPIIENHSPLVSLKTSELSLIFEPSVKEDYRYMVRKELVEKIGRISKALDNEDKKLIIRSAWRSFEHQRILWDNEVHFLQRKYPYKSEGEIREIVSHFIAPEYESMHSTGGAVDALIYDLEEDCVLDFGTNDGLNISLNKKCYPYHPDVSRQARDNRKLLIHLFEKENFVVNVKEYWHFDYGNAVWAIQQKKPHAIYDIIKVAAL